MSTLDVHVSQDVILQPTLYLFSALFAYYAALLWQKEASDKSYISCKSAKCVCHFH